MVSLCIVATAVIASLITLSSICSGYDQRPPGPNERPVLIDTEQVALMEINLKTLILKLTEECKDLNSYLRNTPTSLDWIGRKSARNLLNLAINLDDVFGYELLELLLRQ